MERAADLEAQLVESLNSVGTIKPIQPGRVSNFRTENRFVGLLETIYKSGLNSMFSSSSGALVTQLITLIVLWWEPDSLWKLRSHLGITVVLFHSRILYRTCNQHYRFNRTLQDAKIAADRLFEIFDLEIDDEKDKIELRPEMVNDICFENVKFRYGTRVEVLVPLTSGFTKGNNSCRRRKADQEKQLLPHSFRIYTRFRMGIYG